MSTEIFVGLDVAKDHLDVALRPSGEGWRGVTGRMRSATGRGCLGLREDQARQPHNTCITSVALTSQYRPKTPAAAGAGQAVRCRKLSRRTPTVLMGSATSIMSSS